MASRFIAGDDLGNIKILWYSEGDAKTHVLEQKTVLSSESKATVQKLSIRQDGDESCLFAAAYDKGKSVVYCLTDDDAPEIIQEFDESRISKADRFVGLHIGESLFTCTSNGSLRRAPLSGSGKAEYATLPSRLTDWKLNESGSHFVYGGDEVDISVWDTSLAFQTPETSEAQSASSKKRKRNELFPGEVWRAKNLPNDSLSLRQPIRVTSIEILESSASKHDIVAGSQLGEVRRYDTRTARRPVAVWKDLAKVAGVGLVKRGSQEHEIFVADNGTNICAVDLRVGRILYTYKGLAGAVTAVAESDKLMVSTARDRYARVHSVAPAPTKAGSNVDARGEVLHKEYLTSTPTAIVWDGRISLPEPTDGDDEDEDEDEDVWDKMARVD